MAQYTVKHATTLNNFFVNLKKLWASNAPERGFFSPQQNIFRERFMEDYSLETDLEGWKHEVLLVSTRPGQGNFGYDVKVTEGYKHMLAKHGIVDYVNNILATSYSGMPEFNELPNMTSLVEAIEALVAAREEAQVKRLNDFKVAQQFVDELFDGFDWVGYKLFQAPEYGAIARGEHANGNNLAVEINRYGVEIRVWNNKTNQRQKVVVDVKQGAVVADVRENMIADWQTMNDKLAGKNQKARGDLAALKKIDRKFTEAEAKFMGALFTLSDMGQPASYKVTDNKFKLENQPSVELTSLNDCYWTVNHQLQNLMESDEIEQAITAEKADWTKMFQGNTKEKYTLAKLAKHWPDMLPLCMWFAVNNK